MNIPLTPLDGRYYSKIEPLVAYLSESALIKHRVLVEVAWLKYLCGLISKPISDEISSNLDKLVSGFSESDCEEVREIEKTVNHDVKAVEMFINGKLTSWGQESLIPFVHFGRTSEDINNVAYALMLKGARDNVLLPALRKLASNLGEMAKSSADKPMLSRTHGQPATPTTFGKEVAVFAHRMGTQLDNTASVPVLAKFNGATGTFGADEVAYPEIDWQDTMKVFIETLGLEYNPLTTQIESHDWIARLNNEFALSGTIATDLCRDFWQYISVGYLKQTIKSGEVGSSTMPHKVNPIDFENAEANFGIANALLRHLSEKLPISRLQRDLSDSSALRSLSTAYGHYYLALQSLAKGLSKVYADSEQMLKELDNEWALLTEAVQTIMRKNGIPDAYNQMKDLSRGKPLDKETLHAFIQGLDIDDKDKQALLDLTPQTYIGLASNLAKN